MKANHFLIGVCVAVACVVSLSAGAPTLDGTGTVIADTTFAVPQPHQIRRVSSPMPMQSVNEDRASMARGGQQGGVADSPVCGIAGTFPGAIWAGRRYTSATFEGAGTLANAGDVMFGPPTVGFSADFWYWGQPTSPGFYYFGGVENGNPPANFAWELRGELIGACTTTKAVPCIADITNSGSVGVPDLLELLGCWGPLVPGGGCEDADLTDRVLLNNWGECPPPQSECAMLTQSQCAAEGGEYAGDDVECP